MIGIKWLVAHLSQFEDRPIKRGYRELIWHAIYDDRIDRICWKFWNSYRMQRENQSSDQNRSAFRIIPYSAELFFFNPKSTVRSRRTGQLEVKQQITNKLELAWHVFLLLGIITKRLNNKSNTHAACCHVLFLKHTILAQLGAQLWGRQMSWGYRSNQVYCACEMDETWRGCLSIDHNILPFYSVTVLLMFINYKQFET